MPDLANLDADILVLTCLALDNVPAIGAMSRTCSAWRQALKGIDKMAEYKTTLAAAVALRFPQLQLDYAERSPKNAYRVMQRIKTHEAKLPKNKYREPKYTANSMSSFIFTVTLTNHRTWMGYLPADRIITMEMTSLPMAEIDPVSEDSVLSVYVTSRGDGMKTILLYYGNWDDFDDPSTVNDDFFFHNEGEDVTKIITEGMFDPLCLAYADEDHIPSYDYPYLIPVLQPLAKWYSNDTGPHVCKMKLKFGVEDDDDLDDSWLDMNNKTLKRYLRSKKIYPRHLDV